MKSLKILMIVAVSVFGMQALSATLTYELAGGVKGEEFDKQFFLDFCGLPETFSIDSEDSLGDAIIEKTQKTNYGTFTYERIELSFGAMSGGDLAEPFVGDYRNHVYLTKQVLPDGGYAPGIWHHVDIMVWGDTWAPKAFEVQTQLLNHKASAELAEDWFCRQYSYVLVN